MNNKIIRKWSESVSDEDKRVGMQVLELCIERDSLNGGVFDIGEIFDIINFYVSDIVNMCLCISLFH